MELRSCRHEHFIQAIRGGAVIKLLNTNRPGRPPLSFKLLKDVCETIDAKEPRQHSTMSSLNTSADFLVDRTLREVKLEQAESVPESDILGYDLADTMMLRELKDRILKRKRKSLHGEEHFELACAEVKDEIVPHLDNGMDSDLDDEITLKQLRKRIQRKDKKSGIGEKHSTLSYSKTSSVDESNLTEPMVALESEKSEGSVDFSATTTAIMKTEQNRLIGGTLTPIVPAKVEDNNVELESPSGTSVADVPFLFSDEVPCSYGGAPSGAQTIKVQPETRDPLSSLDGCQICCTNEISYSHLEDIEVEAISASLPSDGMNVTLENIELLCHEGLEEICELNNSFYVQTIDMVQSDDNYKVGLPLEPVYSPSSPNKNCSPSQISVSSTKVVVPVAAPNEICCTNEISYDHLEDIEMEAISASLPSDGMNVTLENIQLLCHEGLDEIYELNNSFCVQNIDMVQSDDNYKVGLPLEPVYSLSSPNKNCRPSQISASSTKVVVPVAASDEEHPISCALDDISESRLTCKTIMDDLLKDEKQVLESLITYEECQSSPKNHIVDCDSLENPELLCHEVTEEISEQNSSFFVQNIGMVGLDDKYKTGSPLEQAYSLSIPNKNCSPSQISFSSSKASVPVASSHEEHPVACRMDEITENGLICRPIMYDLLKDEKQSLEYLITFEECQFSPKDQSVDCVEMDSTIETDRPPERLFSTRKAISPSSQKLLCSAMMSDDDLCNDADRYIGSKEQLHEVGTGQKDSSGKSEIHHPKRTVNRVRNERVSQRKNHMSSKNIPKSNKTKVNLEGPHFPRFLSKLSTECISIEGCSKNAIAFSERQMLDMESLAFKLLDELDSMKSIVEQKLLFTAYRSVSFKSDAEVVKSAIGKASKTKETARKLLSTMGRDCKRFCKIMEMTPNSSPDPKDRVLTKRRKIIFADEAGGKLCHIKYFGGTHSCVTE